MAHLRSDLQKGGFKRTEIRVIAQIGQPFADRVEFGGHVKNVPAIRRMHRPVGASDVVHVERKFAVRRLKLHDAAVGGDEKADAHGQNGQADLRIHPCILNGLPVIVEWQFDPGPLAKRGHNGTDGDRHGGNSENRECESLKKILNKCRQRVHLSHLVLELLL